jgi:hypothetical protein
MTTRRAAGRAAVVGGVSAVLVTLGFVSASLSDDGEGVAYAVGLVLLLLGSIGLSFGPLILQLREGLLALRHDRSPARSVLAVTAGVCGAATAVFLVGFSLLTVARGSDPEGVDWADLPSAAVFFVPWFYAAIAGAVVIGVIEVVGRTRRRRSRI